jgi:hypothetical protein
VWLEIPLGLHYNYFTLNGSQLLNDNGLVQYGDLALGNFEDKLQRTKEDDLITALYG